ncbi:dTDP-4-dehydrorhamnose 3,5-epimerase [Hyphomicrobiales bacterium]|nr:dTDP-4-dehydrorhamnose 3,5-epimerase [Hyphomicrobiales bacterium]
MMKKIKLFNDVFKISPHLHSDERGTFTEDYNKNEFFKLNINDNFLQDNISFSEHKNTIRGLHFQLKPHSQSKLIKVIDGSIFDVFIDLRKESSTYNKFESFILKKNDGWIYIPEGFAHGFCTLENKTTVHYKVNNYYDKNSDKGIIWNDPFFNINWPLEGNEPIISEKDKKLPMWSIISQDIDF